jgi:PilZ domain
LLSLYEPVTLFPGAEASVREHRGDERGAVSWPVRVWLGQGVFVVARALDASAGGLRLTLSPRAKTMIHVDRSYTIELDSAAAPIRCVATVRHADGDVGLAFLERQPTLAGFGSLAEAPALT